MKQYPSFCLRQRARPPAGSAALPAGPFICWAKPLFCAGAHSPWR